MFASYLLVVYTGGMSTYPSTENKTGGTSRRGCALWALGVAALLVIAIIIAFPRAVTFVNNYFVANGTWYGPMKLDVGPLQGTLETYMALSTSPTGSISGNGEFCLPNLIGGGVTTAGFGVTGQHQSDGNFNISVSYELSGPLGLNALLGPQLDLHGSIASETFHLSGGGSHTPATMTLLRGTTTNFTAACHTLSPLGVD